MRVRTSMVCWIVAAATGLSAQAMAAEYEIDKGHSTVLFKVKNRDLSYIYGRFNDISGKIITDRLRNPRRYQFDLTIKARSVDTNNKKRDRHLKSNDFFASTKNPEITFKASKCKKIEEGRFEITGQITILGVKRPLTVEFVPTGFKELEKLKYRMGGEAQFTVKRSELGMSFMIPEIADEVVVMVSLEAECTVVPSG